LPEVVEVNMVAVEPEGCFKDMLELLLVVLIM
jgi:hypothetical protein